MHIDTIQHAEVSIGVTRVLTWVIFKKGHAGLNPKIEMSRLIVMLVLFNIWNCKMTPGTHV
jgi:hypothetical protein